MNNRKYFWLSIVAAAALGATGCGDSNDNGDAQVGEAFIYAAHLAPEVPAAGDTAVAIYVNGEEVTALGTISYGEATGRVMLPAPATYDIGIGLAGGDGPLLELTGVELNDGDDIAAVAYRTNEMLPVNVFTYNLSTEGLASGSGRVFVSHGANDSALDPVNISLGEDPDCSTLLPDFAFGTTAPGEGEPNLDLAADTYPIGFDVADDECPEVGPVGVPVTADVTSIVVAVDENTADGELDPQLWAIVDAGDPIALIEK
jgi:hypothetical protein